jgi:two-component system, NtrC family, sensor kinase
MARILCVDDSTYAASALVTFLEHHGHTITLASDARTALQTIEDRKIQVALLDCHIPLAEEVAKAIRHARPNMPIVMISAYCGVPCERLQYADSCLQKGYAPASLLATIEALLRSRRYGLCRSVPYRVA